MSLLYGFAIQNYELMACNVSFAAFPRYTKQNIP